MLFCLEFLLLTFLFCLLDIVLSLVHTHFWNPFVSEERSPTTVPSCLFVHTEVTSEKMECCDLLIVL